jgi:hypothetical protein
MGIETGNIRRERAEKNSQAELKLEQADGVGNWSKAHPEAQSQVNGRIFRLLTDDARIETDRRRVVGPQPLPKQSFHLHGAGGEAIEEQAPR